MQHIHRLLRFLCKYHDPSHVMLHFHAHLAPCLFICIKGPRCSQVAIARHSHHRLHLSLHPFMCMAHLHICIEEPAHSIRLLISTLAEEELWRAAQEAVIHKACPYVPWQQFHEQGRKRACEIVAVEHQPLKWLQPNHPCNRFERIAHMDLSTEYIMAQSKGR